VTVETCSHGIARLMCGDVQWWEAALICGGALLLGALIMQIILWMIR
jgi:hypothetical protein